MAETPKIREYKCTYSNAVGISDEVTEGLGLEFPDAYTHSETMQTLAKAIKAHDKSDFVLLPFCRTVEVEAMGADINMGNSNTGPRAKDPICSNIDEVLALPEIDFEKGRIREVLNALQEMKAQGETTAIEITGPFTMLSSLMEARLVFKAMRKEKEKFYQALWKLGKQILQYMDEAQKAGVDVIIYSDSAGSLNILGPKMTTDMVENYLADFMKKAEEHIGDECILLICPKFTNALIDTGAAEYRDYQLEEGIDFLSALLQMRGKVKLAGQVCIKAVGVKLANGRFREIVIK